PRRHAVHSATGRATYALWRQGPERPADRASPSTPILISVIMNIEGSEANHDQHWQDSVRTLELRRLTYSSLAHKRLTCDDAEWPARAQRHGTAPDLARRRGKPPGRSTMPDATRATTNHTGNPPKPR